MNDTARRITEPSLAGGISKQPAHIRLPGQVEDAENFDFPLSKGGAVKRLGTWLKNIPMLAPTTLEQPVGDRNDGRILPFLTGDGNRYVLLVGNGTLQIIDLDFNWRCGFNDIEFTQSAWDYLTYQGEGVTPALTADNLRLISVGDDAMVINTLRPTEAGETESFVVTRIFDTVLSMYQFPPQADGTYYLVQSSDQHYQFSLPNSDSTFAKVVCPTPAADWLNVNGQWDDNESGGRRAGFKVLCQNKLLSISGKTATNTAGGVTIAEGGVASFDDLAVNDMVYFQRDSVLTGTFNNTNGWAIIKAITGSSPNRVVDLGDQPYQEANGIAPSIAKRTGGDPAYAAPTSSGTASVSITKRGKVFQASLPGYGDASSSDTIPTTIQGIALHLMQNDTGTGFGAPDGGNRNLLSKGGADGDNIRVWWDTTNQKMVVVSPYAGDESAIIGLYDPENGTAASSPETVLTQGTLSGSTQPFDGRQSNGAVYTDGTGTTDDASQDFVDQFTMVAAPGTVSGDIESSTMPMRVRRVQDGSELVKPKFKIEEFEWDARVTGNEDNNPLVDILNNQSPIADAAIHRDRLWLVGGPFIAASAAGDPFRFYAENAAVPADDDPIGLRMSADKMAEFYAIEPFRQTLVLFSRSGAQFELNSATGALTQSTAAITQTTSFDTLDVPPVASGNTLWFLTRDGDTGDVQLRSYQYADSYAAADAEDVSAHYEGALPEKVRSLVVVPNEGSVLVLADDDTSPTAVGSRSIHRYQTRWQGGRQIQSAWTEHTTARYMVDAIQVGGEVFLLTCRNDGGQTLLEQWPMREEADVYPNLRVPSEGVPNEAVTDAVTFTAAAVLAEREKPTQFTVGDYGFTDQTSAKLTITINESYDGSLDPGSEDYSGEEPFRGPYTVDLEYLGHTTSGSEHTISWGTRAAFAYDSDGDGATDVSPSSGSLYEKSTFQVTDRTGTTYYFFIRVTLRYDVSGGTYDLTVETPFDHFNIADPSLPTFPGNTSSMEVWLGHDGSVGSAAGFINAAVTPSGRPHVEGLTVTATEDHPTDVTAYTATTSLWANSTVRLEAFS